MRNFNEELSRDKCWDSTTQRAFAAFEVPVDDCLLQTRDELVALCEWINEHDVRSYLEIGAWTGRLASTLHRLFSFDVVAVCDTGQAAEFGLPWHSASSEMRTFWGDSHSHEYEEWRECLGPIDLVFIDGDHSYAGVRRDFEINRKYRHRFLAFHDITGSNHCTLGVRDFWNELDGHKVEILRPHTEIGSLVPTMGIGIWWE